MSKFVDVSELESAQAYGSYAEEKLMSKVNEEVEHGQFVFGILENNGRGYSTFKDAHKVVKHFDKPPYQSLWKVDGKIYILVKILERPVFDFYEREEV